MKTSEHRAKMLARMLAKKMRGKGWKPQAWRDRAGSWQYAARQGESLSVHEVDHDHRFRCKGERYYFSLFSCHPGGHPHTEAYWCDTGYFTDPNMAVRDALRKVRVFIRKVMVAYNLAGGGMRYGWRMIEQNLRGKQAVCRKFS